MAGANEARPFSPAEASRARDSSPRFSGEGRAGHRETGAPGGGGSAAGDGQGLLPDSAPPPHHGSGPGPPRPRPLSGEKVRLLALPNSSNESHIHSTLCLLEALPPPSGRALNSRPAEIGGI